MRGFATLLLSTLRIVLAAALLVLPHPALADVWLPRPPFSQLDASWLSSPSMKDPRARWALISQVQAEKLAQSSGIGLIPSNFLLINLHARSAFESQRGACLRLISRMARAVTSSRSYSPAWPRIP